MLSSEKMQQPQKKLKEDGAKRKVSWKPHPILPEELTGQPPLVRAFIGVLKNKQGISKAITGLAKILPSPQHLKRCSGLKIYLTSVDRVKDDVQDMKKLLVEKEFDLTLLEDEFEIVEVPLVAPKTKSQMAYASKFWPVNFHPDQHVESLISGSIFNQDQLMSLEKCMKLAVSLAEETAIGSNECNGSALIVDPEVGAILAMAASSLDKHPMWHASMIAVDLVATIQGGGTWNLLESPKTETIKRKHQLTPPLFYPSSLEKIKTPSDLVFGETVQKKSHKMEPRGPYLCTGYWAVLLQEPCPLCAMALLHSRVSRIFYGVANPNTGILGSKAALHSIPGVNHRYQVWSSVLEDECSKSLRKCRKV